MVSIISGLTIAKQAPLLRVGKGSSAKQEVSNNLTDRSSASSDSPSSESAKRNARIFTDTVHSLNDSASYVAVAEVATNNLKAILSKTKDLATRASDATATTAQRTALDTEAKALATEYSRVIDTAKYKGTNLFLSSGSTLVADDGSGTGIQIQASLSGGLSKTNFISQTASVSSVSAEGNAYSETGSISANGRYVAFDSDATNLVGGDGNGTYDVFVRDLQSGTTQRASSASDGTQANAVSFSANISANGKFVAFSSFASNLVAGDTNGSNDAFVKNLETGETVRVSTSTSGVEGNGASYAGGVSNDGRYVLFGSSATNLVAGDTSFLGDIFLKDLSTGVTTRLSTASDGTEANDSSGNATFTDDSKYLIFSSSASNLVAGDTNAATDIFRKDLTTGEIIRLSTSSTGAQLNGSSGGASVSGDGRYILFSSLATNAVAGDNNGAEDVFIRDTLTGTTSRVSTSASGNQSNDFSLNTSISGDGRYAVFGSYATNLTPEGGDGTYKLYVKDLQQGTIKKLDIDDRFDYQPQAKISADGRYITSSSGNLSALSPGRNGSTNVFVATNPLLQESSISRLSWVDLSTKSNAADSAQLIDAYTSELDTVVGQTRAIKTRLKTASASLTKDTSTVSVTPSLRDIGGAESSAQILSNQIRQQATTAVSAQANQNQSKAQILLNLLG